MLKVIGTARCWKGAHGFSGPCKGTIAVQASLRRGSGIGRIDAHIQTYAMCEDCGRRYLVEEVKERTDYDSRQVYSV